MRKGILTLLFLTSVFYGWAQNKTILITESKLPYISQTWFYSGAGNSLQESKIKSNWDEGKRITSAGYTDHGWFVTMAKETGIGMQTYKISSDWPKDWIKQNWDDDYYITSISRSESQWLVIMSKEAGYTAQTWNRTDWDSMSKWIKDNWDAGYYITSASYNGTYWTVVMSKHSKFTSQGYLWANNTDGLKSKIKSNVWDKESNVQLIEFGGGEYFVVYCKYKENNNRGQYWYVNPSDVGSYIQEKWNESQNIAYIGSGYPTSTSINQGTLSSVNRNYQTNNQVRSGRLEDMTLYFTNSNKSLGFRFEGSWLKKQRFNGEYYYEYRVHGSTGEVNVFSLMEKPKEEGNYWVFEGASSFEKIYLRKDCQHAIINRLEFSQRTDEATYKRLQESYFSFQRAAESYAGSSSNGSSSSSSSNSSSSSTTRSGKRTCPGCNGKGKGADQITWSPNYTGRDNSQYCSVCRQVKPAHSHHSPMCRTCYGKGYIE